MSTICKIDRNVRTARFRRREAMRGAMAAAMRATGLQQEAMVSFSHRLIAVYKNPRLSGTQKEAQFRTLFRLLAAT